MQLHRILQPENLGVVPGKESQLQAGKAQLGKLREWNWAEQVRSWHERVYISEGSASSTTFLVAMPDARRPCSTER